MGDRNRGRGLQPLLLAALCGCRACPCPEAPFDPDCIEATASIAGLHWATGASVTVRVDDVELAHVDCTELPMGPEPLDCAVELLREFDVTATIQTTGTSTVVGILVDLDGYDGPTDAFTFTAVLPDGSTDGRLARFRRVGVVDDAFQSSEACPDRECRIAQGSLGWDGLDAGSGTGSGSGSGSGTGSGSGSGSGWAFRG